MTCIYCKKPLPALGILWHWFYEDFAFGFVREDEFAIWLVSR